MCLAKLITEASLDWPLLANRPLTFFTPKKTEENEIYFNQIGCAN